MNDKGRLELLTTSQHYPNILEQFCIELRKKGKVNRQRFWREQILPLIPNFNRDDFYRYLHKYEPSVELTANRVIKNFTSGEGLITQEEKVRELLSTAAVNVQIGVAAGIKVGSEALQEMIEHPERVPPEDRARFIFDAMKAQDSRIRAIAEIKKDAREERAFNKVFEDATYAEVIDQEPS